VGGFILKVSTVFAVIALAAIWVILTETISWQNAAFGVGMGVACMFFITKFLPFKKIGNANFWNLITYPFYLVGQIYIAGFHIIKIVLTGFKIDIVSLDTKITDEALRIILVDSITLTPGSIMLDLDKQKITLLWIRDKNAPGDCATADELLKRRLENRLLKAQR